MEKNKPFFKYSDCSQRHIIIHSLYYIFLFYCYSLVEGGFTDLWLKNLNEDAESQNRKVKKTRKTYHCDLNVSRSQAKILENFANYVLKPKANNNIAKYTCKRLLKSITVLDR